MFEEGDLVLRYSISSGQQRAPTRSGYPASAARMPAFSRARHGRQAKTAGQQGTSTLGGVSRGRARRAGGSAELPDDLAEGVVVHSPGSRCLCPLHTAPAGPGAYTFLFGL
jgi:hypothetical protein